MVAMILLVLGGAMIVFGCYLVYNALVMLVDSLK